ncbi:hypothetical protein ACRAQ7_04030 [Erythrobacter sp. W53]|uniref:hypothetical protein n=1 Tax=Erythrobacter sp. W53 TaxID=3425947 RepID=UPI003D768895
MTAADTKALREELTVLAMKLVERDGKEIDRTLLASEAGLSRARVEAIFPEADDLFDAIVELWYADDVEIMEQAVASNLPIQRKFYEFFARRFVKERARYLKDPALFALYCELGTERFEQVRGYIDLADHYLSELIAQAQDEGYFGGLEIGQTLSLINQMLSCYTSPQMMMIIEPRLAEEKLAAIIDTAFAGLSSEVGTCQGVSGISAA